MLTCIDKGFVHLISAEGTRLVCVIVLKGPVHVLHVRYICYVCRRVQGPGVRQATFGRVENKLQAQRYMPPLRGVMGTAKSKQVSQTSKNLCRAKKSVWLIWPMPVVSCNLQCGREVSFVGRHAAMQGSGWVDSCPPDYLGTDLQAKIEVSHAQCLLQLCD